MHTTVGIATLWAAALASSRTLRRWSLDRYGKAVALRVHFKSAEPNFLCAPPHIQPDHVLVGPPAELEQLPAGEDGLHAEHVVPRDPVLDPAQVITLPPTDVALPLAGSGG